MGFRVPGLSQPSLVRKTPATKLTIPAWGCILGLKAIPLPQGGASLQLHPHQDRLSRVEVRALDTQTPLHPEWNQ